MPQKVTLPLTTPDGDPVVGEVVAPGLCAHKSLGKGAKGWTLAHIPTGKYVLTGASTKRDLLTAAEELIPAADWTEERPATPEVARAALRAHLVLHHLEVARVEQQAERARERRAAKPKPAADTKAQEFTRKMDSIQAKTKAERERRKRFVKKKGYRP